MRVWNHVRWKETLSIVRENGWILLKFSLLFLIKKSPNSCSFILSIMLSFILKFSLLHNYLSRDFFIRYFRKISHYSRLTRDRNPWEIERLSRLKLHLCLVSEKFNRWKYKFSSIIYSLHGFRDTFKSFLIEIETLIFLNLLKHGSPATFNDLSLKWLFLHSSPEEFSCY